MKPLLVIGHVAIKARTIYRCSCCETTALGDTATFQATVDLVPHELADWLKYQPISNSHMPVGWASFGAHDHRCPQCQEKPQ